MITSPSVLKALDDLVRADLISQRDWYANCIFWSTLAVVVGCALEVPEVLDELWDTLFAKKTKKLIKWVASVGLGLVVLGVAGELCFEHWRSRYEGLLEDFGNILLVDAERQAASAQIEAGDAVTSAQKANSLEAALEIKAKSLERQLEVDKSHIVWLGARNNVIVAKRKQFDKYLSPFQGQRVVVAACWGQYISRGDQEISATASTLAIAVLQHSKWRLQQMGVPLFNEDCGTVGMGVNVFVRSDAPDDTKKAAKRLKGVLDDVLLESGAPIEVPAEGLFIREQGRTQKQFFDKDVIFVDVLMHTPWPMGPTPSDKTLLK